MTTFAEHTECQASLAVWFFSYPVDSLKWQVLEQTLQISNTYLKDESVSKRQLFDDGYRTDPNPWS